MPRAVWLAMLLSLGCAGARPTTEPDPFAAKGPPLDAMLLPPVDGQLALWVSQPANFAVVGVAEHGADVLYQQTALEGIPTSGYVYVPRGDVGYDRVYLVASREPIDLSGSLEDAMVGASVVDAYAADTVRLDSLRCDDGRLQFVRRIIVTDKPKRTREEDERFAECYLREHFAPHRYALREGRQFFATAAPANPQPTHKSLPPGFKPPKVVPKPGGHLERNDERALRWYASKDQWHAITHNGQPGTELPHALGYVHYGSEWVPGRANVLMATAPERVRAIVNGAVGAVRSTSALVMESSGRIETAHASASGGSWSGHASAGYSSGYSSGYHESASHASYSAPSSGAPSHEASSSISSASSSSAGSHRP